MKSTITHNFHASVTLPDEIANEWGDTEEFKRDLLNASKDATAAGSNTYSEWEEWAEYHEMRGAQAYIERMKEIIRKWTCRLPLKREV